MSSTDPKKIRVHRPVRGDCVSSLGPLLPGIWASTETEDDSLQTRSVPTSAGHPDAFAMIQNTKTEGRPRKAGLTSSGLLMEGRTFRANALTLDRRPGA